MGLILDSSLVIADERGKFDLRVFLETRDETVVLSSITASELLYGCYRAKAAGQRIEVFRKSVGAIAFGQYELAR